MTRLEELRREADRQARRIRDAERDSSTLLAQTVYLGTLGLVFVFPVVAGAWLGSWIDGLYPGYSVSWTISLLLLGVVIGAVNVYLLIRNRA